MKRIRIILVAFIFMISIIHMINPLMADKDNHIIKKDNYWKHIDTGIVAIDPTVPDGFVTTLVEVTIEDIGFTYKDYESFILIPDDGEPSLVLIFKKGSVKSTLYLDSDAKKLIDESGSHIEIVGMGTLDVKKSDIKKIDDSGLYAIDVTDNLGDPSDLKDTLDNEIVLGSKTVYPKITTPTETAVGSTVVIKESITIDVWEVRGLNDLILWLNLTFSTNIDNDEKKILQDGIFVTLEEIVEDATSAPSDPAESEPVIAANVCQ